MLDNLTFHAWRRWFFATVFVLVALLPSVLVGASQMRCSQCPLKECDREFVLNCNSCVAGCLLVQAEKPRVELPAFALMVRRFALEMDVRGIKHRPPVPPPRSFS